MTDVWITVGKKHCDICKCWVYNNKISWDRHEQGGRHKANVAKKLRDIGRKKYERDLANREEQAFLMQMNAGAAASMRAEEKSTSACGKAKAFFPSTYVSSSSSSSHGSYGGNYKNDSQNDDFAVWFESITEQGRVFYWNCVTGKSQWKAPKEGYVTMAAQLQQQNARKFAHKPEPPKQPLPPLLGQPMVQPMPLAPAAFSYQPKIEQHVKIEQQMKVEQQSEPLKDVVKESSAPVYAGHPYGEWEPVVKSECDVAQKPETASSPILECEKAYADLDDEEELQFGLKVAVPTTPAPMGTTFKKRKNVSSLRRTKAEE